MNESSSRAINRKGTRFSQCAYKLFHTHFLLSAINSEIWSEITFLHFGRTNSKTIKRPNCYEEVTEVMCRNDGQTILCIYSTVPHSQSCQIVIPELNFSNTYMGIWGWLNENALGGISLCPFFFNSPSHASCGAEPTAQSVGNAQWHLLVETSFQGCGQQNREKNIWWGVK